MKQVTLKEVSVDLLRAPQVLTRLNISRATLYRGIKAGHYPQPVQISSQGVRWRRTEIDALIEQGIEALMRSARRRRGRPPRPNC